MFLQAFGENKDVVQVNENKLVYHILENAVNKTLEDSRSIRYAKRHHQVLPFTRRSVKCCLPFIPLSDA